MAVIDGRPDPALGLAADVAEWARSVGDARYAARAQTLIGVVTVMADPVAGEQVLAEAIAAADRASDSISSVLGRLVQLVSALHQDDHVLLAQRLDEGRPVFESASGQMQAMYHAFSGWSDLRIGRLEAARGHAAMASTLAERHGDAVFAGALFVLLQVLIELEAGCADDAASLLKAVLREPRSAGPTREDPMLTGAWGCVLAARGQVDEAATAIAEGLRLALEVGDGLQIAFCRAWHAAVLRLSGKVADARSVAHALLEHARQQHNASFEAFALRELCFLAALEGDLDAADELAHTALALSTETGLLPDVAVGLACAACIAAAEESWEEAARLFGAAETARHRLGTVLAPWDEPVVEAAVEGVRRSLDDEALKAAWNQGQALTLQDAVAYAQRGRGERKRPTTGWASLTPMERQVVELLSGGLRNTEIAERLFIAPSTVKTHLGHVFAKLGVSTRAELAVLAAARKL
jgi:DNA-binding CsgD family transcriptional regulator